MHDIQEVNGFLVGETFCYSRHEAEQCRRQQAEDYLFNDLLRTEGFISFGRFSSYFLENSQQIQTALSVLSGIDPKDVPDFITIDSKVINLEHKELKSTFETLVKNWFSKQADSDNELEFRRLRNSILQDAEIYIAICKQYRELHSWSKLDL